MCGQVLNENQRGDEKNMKIKGLKYYRPWTECWERQEYDFFKS